MPLFQIVTNKKKLIDYRRIIRHKMMIRPGKFCLDHLLYKFINAVNLFYLKESTVFKKPMVSNNCPFHDSVKMESQNNACCLFVINNFFRRIPYTLYVKAEWGKQVVGFWSFSDNDRYYFTKYYKTNLEFVAIVV